MGSKHSQIQESPQMGLRYGKTKEKCELPAIRPERAHASQHLRWSSTVRWCSTDLNVKLSVITPGLAGAKSVDGQYCTRESVTGWQARERYDYARHLVDRGKGRRYRAEEVRVIGIARWARVNFTIVGWWCSLGRTTERAFSSSPPLKRVQQRCHRSQTCQTLQKSLWVPYGGSCSIQRNTRRHCQKPHHWTRQTEGQNWPWYDSVHERLPPKEKRQFVKSLDIKNLETNTYLNNFKFQTR